MSVDIQELLQHESREAIETWCRRQAQSVYLGDRVLCRVLGKYLMSALPHDRSLTPHLALDGYWEMWITMAIARYIKPGMVCLDVGANVGYYSVLLSDWVGPTGAVMALEPEAANCEMLQDNLGRAGPAITSWRGVAASDHNGSALLHVCPRLCGNHAVQRDDDGTANCQRVETVTLDTVIDRADFIKIDVEGHERNVWRGMRKLLALNPKVQIACEWTPGEDPECELAAMATTDGFNLFEVADDGTLKPTTRGELARATDWKMLWMRR